MSKQEDARQDVERIMRRAEAHGLDAERVARALDHRPPPPPEQQQVTSFEPRPRRFASLLGRLPGRSRARTE